MNATQKADAVESLHIILRLTNEVEQLAANSSDIKLSKRLDSIRARVSEVEAHICTHQLDVVDSAVKAARSVS